MNQRRTAQFSGLRFKVVLFFVLPVLLAMSLSTYSHFVREQQVLEEQVRLTATQLADLATGGLRHAMLINDQQMILEVMEDVGEQENIDQIWLVDLNGVIKASSQKETIGTKEDTGQFGCVECHQYPAPERPRTTHIISNASILRVSTPIINEPACHTCHDPELSHLGVLLFDSSLVDIEAHLRRDLAINLTYTFIATLLFLGFGYLLIQKMIVHRIELVHAALEEYAAGSLKVRIPNTWKSRDEISQLATTFNEMADQIDRKNEAQREVQHVREEAIVEERERIARELHDGVAQMLGYISTKVMAIRLNLKKRQYKKADEQLTDIADAVKEQSVDVRASILGLKMAGESGEGLADQIRDYADQCSQMSNIPIDVHISARAESMRLNPEMELQLMRILQEAISNIRKHASATRVEISLVKDNGEVTIKIADNGKGFDLWQIQVGKKTNFGLQMMQERAEAIGAELNIRTAPEAGTVLSVRLKQLED